MQNYEEGMAGGGAEWGRQDLWPVCCRFSRLLPLLLGCLIAAPAAVPLRLRLPSCRSAATLSLVCCSSGCCGGGGGGDVLPLLRYAHASERARVRVQICLEEGTVVEIEAQQMAAAFKLSQQVGT